MRCVKASFGVLLAWVTLMPAACLQMDRAEPPQVMRPFTVDDAIRMTKISGTAFAAFNPKKDFARFSPDGKEFAIVLRRGNTQKNTNDYSLLLFRTAGVFQQRPPKVLVSVSSSSNNPGISDLSWLDDSNSIVFLASHGSQQTQVYSVQCKSGEIRRLTNHRTSITSYAVSKGGHIIVYAAEKPEVNLIDESVLRYGLHVSREPVTSLLRSRIGDNGTPDLFVADRIGGPLRRIRTLDQVDLPVNSSMLSPDGRHLILKTDMSSVPKEWKEYRDPVIQQVFRRTVPEGFPTGMLHLELIDTRTGRSEVLLDSPASYEMSDILWSPDSKSVLIGGVFLPLTPGDPLELDSRRRDRYVVEITLAGRRVTKVAKGNFALPHWNPRSNVVQLEPQSSVQKGAHAPDYVYFQKTGAGWGKLSGVSQSTGELPEIIAEQDLNNPPRVVAVDPRTKQRVVVIESDSQFSSLRLGKVQEIDWIGRSGQHVSGGMYLPPDYVAGQRYPLVIQTHGFREQTFITDGPHVTAAAAQPLANRGFIVLQLRDILPEWVETPSELEHAMQQYEDAIDYLDREGMIDRSRVGIVGFSRTCMYVKYALTHSTHHFAAAVVSDGVDAGYVQYLLFYNVDPVAAADSDAVIGESPFGGGLRKWFEKSPGFGLDRVQTPLQIQALGTDSILTEWEWFAGLRRLQKPVDLVYLPAATHILIKPWDRLVSQQGAVDWFCFWLKNEEDADPQKQKKYTLWRKLRKETSR